MVVEGEVNRGAPRFPTGYQGRCLVTMRRPPEEEEGQVSKSEEGGPGPPKDALFPCHPLSPLVPFPCLSFPSFLCRFPLLGRVLGVGDRGALLTTRRELK